MANLKALRTKIQGVRSTRRITMAMKMVAAAKFRRARQRVEQSRPYGEALRGTFERAIDQVDPQDLPPILQPNDDDVQDVVLVVLSSDRGMCGAMNGNVLRAAAAMVKEQRAQGRNVYVVPVGRKAIAGVGRLTGVEVVGQVDSIGQPSPNMPRAVEVWSIIKEQLASRRVGRVQMVYPHFVSAIQQRPTFVSLFEGTRSLIKAKHSEAANATANATAPVASAGQAEAQAITAQVEQVVSSRYIFEPSASALLVDLIDDVEHFSIFLGMLETSASEQSARMTAMDNASRNAEDLLDTMVTNYNRTRQANITNELTEIVSGAAAISG